MANNIPFQAQGKTYKANATTTSQTITVYADSPCNQVCVANHEPSGTQGHPVYFRISNQANVTVTVPSAGNAEYALVSVPASVKIYTVPFQFSNSSPLYIAFISETDSPECYFTPGEGL